VPGRRLFQRVILLSGTALSPWSVPRDTVAQSTSLADRLNCSSTAAASRSQHVGTPSRALVVQCLRRVDVHRLVDSAAAAAATDRPPGDVWTWSGFGPTLGGGGGPGVLPGTSVDQLVHSACRNRFSRTVDSSKAGIPRRRHRHEHPRDDLTRMSTRISMSVSVSASWNASLSSH